MAVYKAEFQDSKGDVYFWHTDATVVRFNPAKVNGLKSTNTQDALKELSDKVDKKSEESTLTATIGTAYTGDVAPYTQTVPLVGISADDNPIISVVLDADPTVAKNQLNAWSKVTRIVTTTNGLIVYCYKSKPDVEIPIQVKCIR